MGVNLRNQQSGKYEVQLKRSDVEIERIKLKTAKVQAVSSGDYVAIACVKWAGLSFMVLCLSILLCNIVRPGITSEILGGPPSEPTKTESPVVKSD